MYRIFKEEPEQSVVMVPPVSKSDAIRAMIIKYAIGEDVPSYGGDCPEDVVFAEKALQQLASGEKELDLYLGLGGAPLRFIIALVSLIPGLNCRINAEEKLRGRPHEPLISSIKTALVPHGLEFDSSSWPLAINTEKLVLPENIVFLLEPSSSQYLSGLLMAGARAIAAKHCESVTIKLTRELASFQYAEMTKDWLEEAGFIIENDSEQWKVAGYSETPWDREAPVDWSSAAYLVTLAWRTGRRVRVGDLGSHPDSAILDVLSEAGVRFSFDCGSVLRGSGNLKKGLKADAKVCPDLIPTLAMIALVAPEESIFENVDILRNKESDRLKFIMEIAGEAGGGADYAQGKLRIKPASRLKDLKLVSTLDDHRRAMAAALLPAFGDGNEVVIDDYKCVAKSFPSFWKEIAKCGIKMEKQK